MSYSGEAEQVVRISLNGAEVAAKLTGAAAKNIAVMLYAVLKDQHRTKGKMRLSHMLRSGKELKVFAVKDGDLKKFCEAAKKYGVLYCVLKDKNAKDGIQDFKYDILEHPNVTLTTDGKAEPYQHGLDNLSIASIVFDKARQEQTVQEPEVDEDRYELISDEEIEEFLKQQEENEHEEKQKA